MTPTYKETLLADILAALLRIEAKMDAAKVADTEADAVEFYRKLLEEKAKAKRPPTSWPTVPAENWSLEAVHPACRKCIGKPCGNTACPSRPVITCGGNYPEFPDSSPTTSADKATGPSLNQCRWMHGGWIHATGFSMVGP